MNTHADKTSEDKSQAVANSLLNQQSNDEFTFQFVDNRPETIAQRKLQEMANNSLQVKQLRAYQEIANTSQKRNHTGLPEPVKSGIGNLSDHSMHEVQVSDTSAPLQADAYAQETPSQLKGINLPQVVQRIWIQDIGESAELTRDTIITLYIQALQTKKPLVISQLKQAIKNQEFIGDPIEIDEDSSLYHTITLSGKDYSLVDMNTISQEEFYKTSSSDLYSVRSQLDGVDKNTLGPNDKKYLTDILDKVHNAQWIEFYQDKTEQEWVKFNYQPGTGTILHDLVYNVIVEAIGGQSTISEMSYDQIKQYKPETQIAYCLQECIDDAEEVLALCLYTSYFYEPLNKYFRGLIQPDLTTNFGKLIEKTAQILQGSYQNIPATNITRRYKLELKSGWIKGDELKLTFKAPTSTHPDLNGVKSMWSDIAQGTFGAYDNLALLVFEGSAKLQSPTKKYFPNENENIMEPGVQYYMTDTYPITGNIPGLGNQTIRIFHLNSVQHPISTGAKLSFTDVV